MALKTKSVTDIEDGMVKVIEHALKSSSYHEKYVRLLEEVYNQSNFDEFLQVYIRATLNTLTYCKSSTSNSLLINFLAKFVAHINKQAEKNQNENDDEDVTHPFLAAMISEALKLHNTANEIRRCNACTFISQILDSLGDGNLDENLCNKLQEAMLERLQDSNVVVRLRAVRALVRLQDVESQNCPVITAYVRAMNDTAEAVRKEVIHVVAPITKSVVQEIKQHTRDVHPSVRIEAFTKCGNFGHKIFTLRDRQFILSSGFAEEKENVKKCFFSVVLPTWLTAINKDYVELLKAVMMNGDDNDLLLSKDLGQKLIKAFFNSEPINAILDALQLDDNKVLVSDYWKYERIIYWNLTTSYLRQHDDLEEYLDRILPELTPLCRFIEDFISNQSKNFKTEQDYLNFQVSLYYLFDMASQYDLADEVGRRTLQTIVKNVLTNFKSYQINSWNSILMSEIVKIARKLSPDPVKFLEEICQLISDIREPLVDPEPDLNMVREREFKLHALKVKINIMEGNLEDAVEQEQFAKAASIKVELDQKRREMEQLTTPPPSQAEQVRVSRDDPETICWCLDLLNVGIEHSGIFQLKARQQLNNPLPPALITCLDEFLKPLVKSKIEAISCRSLKCILNCCIFDKNLASEFVKMLCMQFVHYQAIPNFNKEIVIVAIKGICDFIMVYGVGIFEPSSNDDTNTTTTSLTNKKKLYTSEDSEQAGSQTFINNHLKINFILEIIFDMLDDENDDVRTHALTALAKLILSNSSDLCVSPQIMTRIILKYFNPLTGVNPDHYNEMKRSRKAYEKASETMQQVLGMIINCYVRDKKDARITLEKAAILIINALANAPRSSPLSEINTDKVIELLAGLTFPSNKDVIDIHRSLAHTLCKEIAAHPHENAVIYYAKMLTRLIIDPNNVPQNKELITQAELLLEIDDLENSTRRHISNFIRKLTSESENLTINQTLTTANTTTNTTAANSTEGPNGNPRILPTIVESDNEASRNGDEHLIEPQNKKSRRESEKENNDTNTHEPHVEENKPSTKPTNDKDQSNIPQKGQANPNKKGRRGRRGRRGRGEKDKDISTSTENGAPEKDQFSEKNKSQKSKEPTSETNKDTNNSNINKNVKQNKKHTTRLKALDNDTSSSESDAFKKDQKVNNTKDKEKSPSKEGSKNKVVNSTEKDKTSNEPITSEPQKKKARTESPKKDNITANKTNNSRKSIVNKDRPLRGKSFDSNSTQSSSNSDQNSKKRKGNQSLKDSNTEQSDTRSGDSDDIIPNSQESTINGITRNLSLLRQTRRLGMVADSSFEIQSRTKKKGKNENNVQNKGSTNKNGANKQNAVNLEITDKTTNKNRVISKKIETPEIFKEKNNRKLVVEVQKIAVNRSPRRNGLRSENSSESVTSNKKVATRTQNNNQLSRKNGGLQRNISSSSETQELNSHKLKNKPIDKIKNAEQLRRSGRFSESERNTSKVNGVISPSRSIQTKRKKSRGMSSSLADSFEDTTILRTIVEPSGHHISLLLNDSLPPSPQRKTPGRRTLTVLSETSSESGSPLRTTKKSRRKK